MGLTVNRDGYLRVKTRGSDRDKYHHRLVIESLAREGPSPLIFKPWERWTVHHMNGDRRDNRPVNLLVLPWFIHAKFRRGRGETRTNKPA